MATQQLQRITQEVKSLKGEFATMRLLVASLLAEDREGRHKKSFIERTKRAIKEKPLFLYKDKRSFLAHLKN